MKLPTSLFLGLSAQLIIAAITTAAPQSVTDRDPPTFMTRADIPGLGTAQVSPEQIQVEVFGYAKIDEQEATEETIFEAASLTKPVIAYLVMRLVERDVLQLDDALTELLPTLQLPRDDPRSKQVTVRMALAHMTGLSGSDDRLLTFAADPGTTFRYYPAGYRLVQRILEHLEGASLQTLARREVFEPLGMTSSALVYKPEFAERLATRHNLLGDPIEKFRDPTLPANAAVSLMTTTGDYARFLQSILSATGLLESSIDAMLEPQIVVESTAGAVAWGLGWGLEPERGTFFHWGDDGATKCFTIGSRSTEQAMVYFTNSFHGMCIAGEMAERVIPGDSPAVEWLGYGRWNSPIRLAKRDILRAFVELGPNAGMSTFRDFEQRNAELDMADIARWMAWLLDSRLLHAERIEILNWQIEQEPNNIDLYLNRARSQAEIGDNANALVTLQEVRPKVDPSLQSYIDGQITWIEGSRLAALNKGESLGLDHETLIGTYDVRRIVSETDALWYQREGRPRYRMIWMHDATFEMEGLDSFRIRFVIEDGRAIRIVGFDPSGNSVESLRSDQ